MSTTRTVTLEILRPGPPHNQLLSPLTPYVAVCSNRSPETLHVDVEHHELLRWMLDLGGQRDGGDGAIRASKAVTRLFGSLRGLAAELAGAGAGERIHLRLVLSAQELASLPFEMADAPQGFPGEGQALFRQEMTPLSITRESRRAPKVSLTWPDRPKILFAWASPPGVQPVPADAHALALRKALDPWIGWSVGEPEEEQLEELAGHLRILPMATWERLTEVCATDRFTHVHILAHGAPTPSKVPGEERFGLLLHGGGASGMRVIDADELDIALRGGNSSAPSMAPTVVTIAACNLGKIGGVILPGSSLAHALHEKGVPLVVASQFPLSFRGSVAMTQVLYGGLLRGEDPRHTLQRARRELYGSCPGTHDWASMVTYASFPENLEAQLPSVQLTRARKKTDVAVHRATVARRRHLPSMEQEMSRLNDAFEELVRLGEKLEAAPGIVQVSPDEAWIKEQIRVERRSRIDGFLASLVLRWGDALLESGGATSNAAPKRPDGRLYLTEMNEIELWRYARARYRNVFRLKHIHWAIVEDMALSWVLGEGLDLRDWSTAWKLASDATDEISHWSCAELALLALSFESPPGELKDTDATKMARARLDDLVETLGARSFRAFSARRQLRRYEHWATRDSAGPRREVLAGIAAELGKHLDRRGVPERWPET